MKKLYTILCCLSLLSLISCDNQNKPIQFEDELTKHICVKNWDSNGDGELSYAEAAVVAEISGAFQSADISIFDEMKYFVGLKSIGESAFEDCSSLTSVTIPDSVTWIGWYAFEDCSSLASITIPDGVTEIGRSAFKGCSSLTSVTIPDGVTGIGDSAFYNCSSLTNITIPHCITSIGECAFEGCSSLTSVTIPDSVTWIGVCAFEGCSSLVEFKGKFASEDGRCLIVGGTLNSFAPAELTEYTIPDGVTRIGLNAFCGCSSLTSVTIPDGVTSIEDYAFRDCSSLTSITIPDSVTSIDHFPFFFCSSLTEVYCKATTPPAGDSDIFGFSASGRKIYVPTESVNAYKSAEDWSNDKSYIYGYDFE